MMDARKLLINLLYPASAQSNEVPGWSHREIKKRQVSTDTRRPLDPLPDAGLIERPAPDRPNSRLQRYRLTDAGRAHLDSISGDAE